MKIRQRQCKICRTRYQPTESFQQWCSHDCAIELLRLKQAKQRRRQDAKERQRLQPRSYWVKQAQAVFNKYIRLRDDNAPCISCGTTTAGQWHASHLYSRSARPDLSFNSDNVHKSCHKCNTFLSGNIEAYRKALLKKIGRDKLEALESVGESPTIDELKAIKKKYQALIKEMKND